MRWWLALVLVAGPAPAFAGQTPQVDLGDVLRAVFHKPAPSDNRSPSETAVAVLPSINYNPAFGLGLGGVMSAAGRRGGPDARLSTLHASVAFTTQKQLITAVRNDLQFRNGAWSLVGDSRFYKGLQRTHGLGSDSQEEPSLLLDYYWTRAHQTLYRQVRGPLRLGAGYHLDYYTGITPRDPAEAPPGVPERTVASGVSVNALVDTRDNSLNASTGVYGRASYYLFPTGLGSDSTWESAQFEGRGYLRMPSGRRQVLALWGSAWLTTEGEPPYFNLPSVGWDTYGRTARGYTAGRFRGQDWMYVEAEYRVDLMRNGLIGAVGFVNTSTLSDANGRYGSWATAGGAGLRVKLDKHNGTNLAMDVAFGRSGSRGVWFGLNEAF